MLPQSSVAIVPLFGRKGKRDIFVQVAGLNLALSWRGATRRELTVGQPSVLGTGNVMLRVQVVEEDDGVQLLLRDIFADVGWESSFHAMAEDAWAAMLQCRPDVVLLDIYLRDQMTGWDLLDRMRENPRTSDIPAVVCTGILISEAVAARLRHACIPLEAMPFDIDHQLETVQAAVGATQNRSSTVP